MADLRTGKLRERVQIYTVTDTDTAFGGTIPSTLLYWDTYANVTPLQSGKSLVSNQEILKDGYQITIRYRSDKIISKSMVMFYRGKWLNLTSLDSDEILKEYITFVGTYQ